MLIPAGKWPLIERYFMSYTRHYIQRSFHAVHVQGALPRFDDDGRTPLLVCMNHSSWWDVMLGLYIEQKLFGWEWYAVMDARQLLRYKFFARLGVIGVDRTSLSGAREFLTYANTLLKGKRRSLWMTPQGEMLSNYARPVTFQPGMGHLAGSLGEFYFTRVVLHYEYWDERLPEAFVSLSPVERVCIGEGGFDRKRWTRAQELALTAQMDTLLADVQSRDHAAFQTVLRGRVGISPTYDAIRALGSKLRGQSFTPEHGEVVTPQWKEKE